MADTKGDSAGGEYAANVRIKRWAGIALILILLVIAVVRPDQHYATMSRGVISLVAGVSVALLIDAEMANRITLPFRMGVLVSAAAVTFALLSAMMSLTAPQEVVALVRVVDQRGVGVPLALVDIRITPDAGAGEVPFGTHGDMLFIVFPGAVGRMNVELAYEGGLTYRGSVSRVPSGRMRLKLADDRGKSVLMEERLKK